MRMLQDSQVLSEDPDPASPSRGHNMLPGLNDATTSADAARLDVSHANHHIRRDTEGNGCREQNMLKPKRSCSNPPSGAGETRAVHVSTTPAATSETLRGRKKSPIRSRSSSVHMNRRDCWKSERDSYNRINVHNPALSNHYNLFASHCGRNRERHNGVSDGPLPNTNRVLPNGNSLINNRLPNIAGSSQMPVGLWQEFNQPFAAPMLEKQNDLLRSKQRQCIQEFNGKQFGDEKFSNRDGEFYPEKSSVNPPRARSNVDQNSRANGGFHNTANNEHDDGHGNKTKSGSKMCYLQDYRRRLYDMPYAPAESKGVNTQNVYVDGDRLVRRQSHQASHGTKVAFNPRFPDIPTYLGYNTGWRSHHQHCQVYSPHYPPPAMSTRNDGRQRNDSSESNDIDCLPRHIDDMLNTMSHPITSRSQCRRQSVEPSCVPVNQGQDLTQQNSSCHPGHSNYNSSLTNSNRYNNQSEINFKGTSSNSDSQRSYDSAQSQHKNAEQKHHKNHTTCNDLDVNTSSESEMVAKEPFSMGKRVSSSLNENVDLTRNVYTYPHANRTKTSLSGAERYEGSTLEKLSNSTKELQRREQRFSTTKTSSSAVISSQAETSSTGEKATPKNRNAKELVPDHPAMSKTNAHVQLNPNASPFKSDKQSEIQEELALAQKMRIPVNVSSNQTDRTECHALRNDINSHLNPRAKEFSPTLTDSYGKTFTMTHQNGVYYFRPKSDSSLTVSDPRYVIQEDEQDDMASGSVKVLDTNVHDAEIAQPEFMQDQSRYETCVQESAHGSLGMQQDQTHARQLPQQPQQLHHDPPVYRPVLQQPDYGRDLQTFNADTRVHYLQQQQEQHQPHPVEQQIPAYTPIVTVPNQSFTVPAADQNLDPLTCGASGLEAPLRFSAENHVGYSLPNGNAAVDHHPYLMNSGTPISSLPSLPCLARLPDSSCLPGIQSAHVAHHAVVPRLGSVNPYTPSTASVNPVPVYYPASQTLTSSMLPSTQTNYADLTQPVVPVPMQPSQLCQAYTQCEQMVYPVHNLPSTMTSLGIPTTYQIYNLHTALTCQGGQTGVPEQQSLVNHYSPEVGDIGRALTNESAYTKTTSLEQNQFMHGDSEGIKQKSQNKLYSQLSAETDKIIDVDNDKQVQKELSEVLTKLMAFKERGDEECLKRDIASIPEHLRPCLELRFRLINALCNENNSLGVSDLYKAMILLDSITSCASVSLIQDMLRELPEVKRRRSGNERTGRTSNLERLILKSVEEMKRLDTPSCLSTEALPPICTNTAAGDASKIDTTNPSHCVPHADDSCQILSTAAHVDVYNTKTSGISSDTAENFHDQVHGFHKVSSSLCAREEKSSHVDKPSDSLLTRPTARGVESNSAHTSDSDAKETRSNKNISQPSTQETTPAYFWRSHVNHDMTGPLEAAASSHNKPSTPHPLCLNLSTATSDRRGAGYDGRSPALRKVDINRRIDLFERMKTGQ